MPEVIEDDITGRLVDEFEEALLALPEVIALDRRRIRARFEARFTAERMASDYLEIYRALGRAARQPAPAHLEATWPPSATPVRPGEIHAP